ncbi:MAG: adenylyltransferase/cytidyltransferase family protein [Candidatus Paceibacteria bacterium]
MKKVMTFGTFDIFHRGHLHFLQEANKLGDRLIVVIARDVNVKKIKGDGPVHQEEDRQDIISSLEVVDKAILGNRENVYEVISQVEPDVIALGYDQTHFVEKLEDKLNQFNLTIEVKRLEPYNEEKYKSSKIKKELFKNG